MRHVRAIPRSLMNAGILTVATVVAQALTAGTMLLVARGTAVAAFGQVMTVIAVTTVASNLLNFGSNALVVREMSSGRFDAAEFASRFGGKILAALSISLVPLGIAVIDKGSERLLMGGGLLLVALTASQMSLTPVSASQQFGRLSLVIILDKAMALCCVLTLHRAGIRSPDALPFALAAGASVSCLLAIVSWSSSLHGSLGSLLRGRIRLTNPWSGGIHIGVSSTLLALTQADVAVLNIIAGGHAAGLYSGVNRWTQPMNLVASSYAQAHYPEASAAGSSSTAWREMARGRWLLVPLLAGVGAIWFSAPSLVVWLLGEQYAASANVLRFLALGTVPGAVNQILYAFLNARRHERSAAQAVAVSVVLQFVALSALATYLGANGAAIAYCLVQVIMLVILGRTSRRVVAADRDVVDLLRPPSP